MPNMDKTMDKRGKQGRDQMQQKRTSGQQGVRPGDKTGDKIEKSPTGSNQ